jgi:c-di-GMP-binding flagellar brake protein YcgR
MFGPRKPVAELHAGQQVLLDIGGERATDLVPTRVYASDAREVKYESPRRAEDAVVFRPGITMTVRYLQGSEMGIFRTTIEEMETAPDGRRVLVAPQPDKVRWTTDIPEPQKRQFSRLDVELEVKYAVQGGDFGEALAVELSGGGLILELTRAVPDGTALEVDFRLGDASIRANGEVVRTIPANNERFHVAVRFLDLDSSDEDAIAHYILEQQRIQRRKHRL